MLEIIPIRLRRRRDASTAKDHFDDNFRRLGPNSHQTDPEKFNLYAGLSKLAEDVRRLTSEVQRVASEVDHLKRNTIEVERIASYLDRIRRTMP